MSKELTEKYYNGFLDDGFYYAKSNDDNNTFVLEENPWLDKLYHNCEILAPVPTFNEVKEMSQKIGSLELDNEALEMAYNEGKEINAELVSKTEQLEKQREKVIALIKDGRFVEALQELEDE